MRWTVISNCDTFFITKSDTVYYKLRQVLQSAMDLLQIATAITKCDDYYKLRQYTSLHFYRYYYYYYYFADMALMTRASEPEQK